MPNPVRRKAARLIVREVAEAGVVLVADVRMRSGAVEAEQARAQPGLHLERVPQRQRPRRPERVATDLVEAEIDGDQVGAARVHCRRVGVGLNVQARVLLDVRGGGQAAVGLDSEGDHSA